MIKFALSDRPIEGWLMQEVELASQSADRRRGGAQGAGWDETIAGVLVVGADTLVPLRPRAIRFPKAQRRAPQFSTKRVQPPSGRRHY